MWWSSSRFFFITLVWWWVCDVILDLGQMDSTTGQLLYCIACMSNRTEQVRAMGTCGGVPTPSDCESVLFAGMIKPMPATGDPMRPSQVLLANRWGIKTYERLRPFLIEHGIGVRLETEAEAKRSAALNDVDPMASTFRKKTHWDAGSRKQLAGELSTFGIFGFLFPEKKQKSFWHFSLAHVWWSFSMLGPIALRWFCCFSLCSLAQASGPSLCQILGVWTPWFPCGITFDGRTPHQQFAGGGRCRISEQIIIGIFVAPKVCLVNWSLMMQVRNTLHHVLRQVDSNGGNLVALLLSCLQIRYLPCSLPEDGYIDKDELYFLLDRVARSKKPNGLGLSSCGQFMRLDLLMPCPSRSNLHEDIGQLLAGECFDQLTSVIPIRISCQLSSRQLSFGRTTRFGHKLWWFCWHLEEFMQSLQMIGACLHASAVWNHFL